MKMVGGGRGRQSPHELPLENFLPLRFCASCATGIDRSQVDYVIINLIN